MYYVGSMPVGSDDLAHYGRKGMKWGQHIFGNERAKPTFGRTVKRGFKKVGKFIGKHGKKAIKTGKKIAQKRKLSMISDEELTKRNKRLKLEQEYIDAINKRKGKKSKQEKGESFIKGLIKKGAGAFTVSYLTALGKRLGEGKKDENEKDNGKSTEKPNTSKPNTSKPNTSKPNTSKPKHKKKKRKH